MKAAVSYAAVVFSKPRGNHVGWLMAFEKIRVVRQQILRTKSFNLCIIQHAASMRYDFPLCVFSGYIMDSPLPDADTGTTPAQILLLDTSAVTRDMLAYGLKKEFSVKAVDNAPHALEALSNHRFDIAILDVNTDRDQRKTLLREIRNLYPKTTVALMTDQDIDHTIDIAQKENIANILTKGIPLNFNELYTYLHAVATREIFGLQRYMRKDYQLIKTYTLQRSDELEWIERDIAERVASFHRYHVFIEILLDEIMTNALYHAPADATGKEKYKRNAPVILDDEEYVRVCFGRDGEKYAVSVLDKSGRLTKEQVLQRFKRHMHKEGLFDESGRGLFLSWSFSDRLFFNIEKEVATEIIAMNFYDQTQKTVKPLYVNEIQPCTK